MEISGSFTVNTCIVHYRHQEFSHWLNLFPWEQLIHQKAAHRKRQAAKTFTRLRISHRCEMNNLTPPYLLSSPLSYPYLCLHIFHPILCCSTCSLLDYLPTLLSLRRLPHLDAPVMITTSVSNINVSVQLGDTTPFALGFLSASGGTAGRSHGCTHAHTHKKRGR